jgi:hypothetical protein
MLLQPGGTHGTVTPNRPNFDVNAVGVALKHCETAQVWYRGPQEID